MGDLLGCQFLLFREDTCRCLREVGAHEVVDSLGTHLGHLPIALIFPVQVHRDSHSFDGPTTPELSHDLQVGAILRQVPFNFCLLASSEGHREKLLNDILLLQGLHVLDQSFDTTGVSFALCVDSALSGR